MEIVDTDERTIELLHNDPEPVDSTTPGSDHTLYLDKDDKVRETPYKYKPCRIHLKNGEEITGVCTSFGRVMGPTGSFYQHEISVWVPNQGSIWVHTGRGNEEEVELDGEYTSSGWNKPLGELELIVFEPE